MAITLLRDAMMTTDDCNALIDESNPQRAAVFINSVSEMFRGFTSRVQIYTTSAVSVGTPGTNVTAANPISVTSTAHGLRTGDLVTPTVSTGSASWIALVGTICTVTVSSADAFTLGVNGTSFGSCTAFSWQRVLCEALSGYGSQSSMTSYGSPTSGQDLWLHATPITNLVRVELLVRGTVTQTLTQAGDDFEIYANEGVLHRNGSVWPGPEGERSVRVYYAGGWTVGQLPGDALMGAVQQMRYERARFDGRVGVTNLSRNGESAAMEVGGLLSAVKDYWNGYRIFA
jgi:hypothetical protein